MPHQLSLLRLQLHGVFLFVVCSKLVSRTGGNCAVSLRPGWGGLFFWCVAQGRAGRSLGMKDRSAGSHHDVCNLGIGLAPSLTTDNLQQRGGSQGSALTGCVNLGKQLNFSGLSFLICTLGLILVMFYSDGRVEYQ